MSFEARYFGRCGECREAIMPGMEISYIGDSDTIVHSSCIGQGESPSGGYTAAQRLHHAPVVCPQCHLEVSRLVEGVCVDCA